MFSKVVPFYIPISNIEVPVAIQPCKYLVITSFYISHSKVYVVVSHFGFNLHFLMTNEASYYVLISYSCLLKIFASNHLSIFSGLVYLLIFELSVFFIYVSQIYSPFPPFYMVFLYKTFTL